MIVAKLWIFKQATNSKDWNNPLSLLCYLEKNTTVYIKCPQSLFFNRLKAIVFSKNCIFAFNKINRVSLRLFHSISNNHRLKPMRRSSFSTLLLFFLATLFVACHNKAIEPLIGGDRDDHGCLSSAGYTWSYALHDCVRIWEVGERFESTQNSVFLVFSADSTFAEIFTTEKSILLRRENRQSNTWSHRRGDERVTIQPNGVITVFANNFYFTKSKTQ